MEDSKNFLKNFYLSGNLPQPKVNKNSNLIHVPIKITNSGVLVQNSYYLEKFPKHIPETLGEHRIINGREYYVSKNQHSSVGIIYFVVENNVIGEYYFIKEGNPVKATWNDVYESFGSTHSHFNN